MPGSLYLVFILPYPFLHIENGLIRLLFIGPFTSVVSSSRSRSVAILFIRRSVTKPVVLYGLFPLTATHAAHLKVDELFKTRHKTWSVTTSSEEKARISHVFRWVYTSAGNTYLPSRITLKFDRHSWVSDPHPKSLSPSSFPPYLTLPLFPPPSGSHLRCYFGVENHAPLGF